MGVINRVFCQSLDKVFGVALVPGQKESVVEFPDGGVFGLRGEAEQGQQCNNGEAEHFWLLTGDEAASLKPVIDIKQ